MASLIHSELTKPWILTKCLWDIIQWGFIDNTSVLVWILAWCNMGTKPLSKPMMTQISGIYTRPERVNSLWPSYAIWHHRSGSTLVQVMACCLTAPSHYLNQCWLILSKNQWYSSEVPQTSITKISLKITYLEFYPNLPGTNELSQPQSAIIA